ncbi:MAG: helix-turn-helix domain-containing protein [Acidaminococcus intestini]|uniref:helix-turn-helix domain-containing protein n=1 Tax=Acidaminococcus intestini TaxID=187327 RepID=UPI00242D8B94|nr:helix-turn-helix domain-containing protein [Acidaminococcus intestini]MBS6985897.1 helix-turn-helix domain-containing protein [Acidaminococcus intestini]
MKHIGEYLKQRRCEKNITLEEVASQTGIREQYLTALESGDFEKIPGDVFIKGFIRNYGNFLEENGNDLVEAYTKGLATPEALHEPLKAAPSDVKEQPEVLQEPASSPASTADATPENDEERTMVVTPSMMEEARRSWEEEEAFEEEQEKTTPKVQAVIKEIDDEPEPDENQKEESGIIKKLRHFIESILYEEVDEDDDEDDDADDEALENGEDRQESPLYAYQKKERQDNRKGVSAYLNIRIFGIVFAIFFGIFCVVMAYFLFGGKTMPEIPATTSLSDSVKSENSSTRKAEEAKKEEKQPETKEEKKGDTKAFGKEQKNGVTVTVTYNKPVWTEADIDGKRVETATVSAGSTRTYNGKSTVKLSFGSIRDVSIKVNGKDYKLKDTEWGTMSKTFRAQ